MLQHALRLLLAVACLVCIAESSFEVELGGLKVGNEFELMISFAGHPVALRFIA